MVTRIIKETSKKEQPPDKLEKFKRLEKERKVIQKKEEGMSRDLSKNTKATKPSKRSNQKDWTRVYEEGLYDDDDLTYMQ